MRFNSFVLFFILTCFSGFKANSGVILVPGQYPTIQAGIKAASNADTVLVDNGTYYENINFLGKNIVVSSRYVLTGNIQDILNTIIDGSHSAEIDTGSCVLMIKGEDSTAVIQGFTITNGTGTSCTMSGGGRYREGGGIILYNSNGVIKNNLIINNQSKIVPSVKGGGGGGISAMYGRPRILNNVIMNNTAPYAAGVVLNWSGGIIRNNIVYGNYGGANFGTGGIMVWKSPYSAIIENNTIVGNISVKDAGGLSITTTPLTIVRNNVIWGNRQATGKQITGATAGMLFNNNTEETYTGTEMISALPEFENMELLLAANSPGIDAGISLEGFNDKENTLQPGYALFPSKGTVRNDLGAYGGSFVSMLPMVMHGKIYVSGTFAFGTVTVPATKKIELQIANFGLSSLTIDSIVTGKRMNTFTIIRNLNGRLLKPFEKDTLKLNWVPVANDTIKDSVLIYHRCTTLSNPFKVPMTGVSKNATTVIKLTEKKDCVNVYPNPCKENVYIENSSNDKNLEISLFNASGKNIRNLCCTNTGTYSASFNTSKLKAGIYFVRIRSEKGERIERLVKL